jgi:hypothetical protein
MSKLRETLDNMALYACPELHGLHAPLAPNYVLGKIDTAISKAADAAAGMFFPSYAATREYISKVSPSRMRQMSESEFMGFGIEDLYEVTREAYWALILKQKPRLDLADDDFYKIANMARMTFEDCRLPLKVFKAKTDDEKRTITMGPLNQVLYSKEPIVSESCCTQATAYCGHRMFGNGAVAEIIPLNTLGERIRGKNGRKVVKISKAVPFASMFSDIMWELDYDETRRIFGKEDCKGRKFEPSEHPFWVRAKLKVLEYMH